MDDFGCIEVVVSRKPSIIRKILKIVLVILAVLLIMTGVVGSILILIVGILCAIGAYLVYREEQVDYEYAYVEKELRIAKVMNKERRKEIAKYDLEKMEILAPVNSWRLGDYKNRKVEQDLDYTSMIEKQPNPCFYMYLEGNVRLKLELAGEDAGKLIEQIYQIAPRKVFRD